MSIDLNPDEAEIREIGEGFLALTFPADRFHHREHLIVTTYLLAGYPTHDWKTELPDLIRSFNIANGGVNDETRGYHHTITMAFLMIVESILAEVRDGDFRAGVAAVLQSPAIQQDVLLSFYTRERLFSSEARLHWVDPDLADIDLRLVTAD